MDFLLGVAGTWVLAGVSFVIGFLVPFLNDYCDEPERGRRPHDWRQDARREEEVAPAKIYKFPDTQ